MHAKQLSNKKSQIFIIFSYIVSGVTSDQCLSPRLCARIPLIKVAAVASH